MIYKYKKSETFRIVGNVDRIFFTFNFSCNQLITWQRCIEGIQIGINNDTDKS